MIKLRSLITELNYDTEKDLRVTLGWALPPDDTGDVWKAETYWIKKIKKMADNDIGLPTFEILFRDNKKVIARKIGETRGRWQFQYKNLQTNSLEKNMITSYEKFFNKILTK